MSLDFPLLIGMTAAVVHVIMGPDHLAAVTPLVLDTQKRHWRIGFLWGAGHIVGMLLIGLLFYFFREFIPVETISTYSEQFVGFILIGLGIWAFYRIKFKKTIHKHPHFHDKNGSGSVVHIHGHEHEHQDHEHTHDKNIKQNSITAVSVGVIHGFAGIAHFVLLLPVLGFQSKLDAVQYIIGFAIGIFIAMISFTLLVGKIGSHHTLNHTKPLYKNLQFWGGILAIGVGIYWIVSNM